MNNLDKVLVIAVILSLVFILMTISFLVLFILRKLEIKKINSSKKSKRKGTKSKIRKLNKKNSTTLKLLLASLFFGVLSGTGAGYITYHQMINLSDSDKENVVKGYYLLVDFENELNLIKTGDSDEKNSLRNIQNLSGSMASYYGLAASPLNKKEGQVLLNRYYNAVKELGVNSSSQAQDFFNNQELTAEFLKDVEKAKSYQQDVIKFYKVDQNELKKNE